MQLINWNKNETNKQKTTCHYTSLQRKHDGPSLKLSSSLNRLDQTEQAFVRCRWRQLGACGELAGAWGQPISYYFEGQMGQSVQKDGRMPCGRVCDGLHRPWLIKRESRSDSLFRSGGDRRCKAFGRQLSLLVLGLGTGGWLVEVQHQTRQFVLLTGSWRGASSLLRCP